MTATAELERIVRGVIPQVGTTGWRITVTGDTHGGTTGYAVVPILYSRLDGAPVFRGGQRDCSRVYDLLTGRIPTEAPEGIDARANRLHRERRQAPTQPDGRRAAIGTRVRLCAGCDQPLPPGARSNRRTHDAACRQRAARRGAEESARPDADGADTDVTDTRAAQLVLPAPAN